MPELTYRTAGESHGPAMIALVEGLPAGLRVDTDLINAELRRRQGGYGRGGRMRIERDAVSILGGVRSGSTLGAAVVLQLRNEDYRIDSAKQIVRPRPGHADLAGSLKWLLTDCRPVAERASARDTAARVAAGALAACFLREFGVRALGFVQEIGSIAASVPADLDPESLRAARDGNEVYAADPSVVQPMIAAIKKARDDEDTLGGIVEVRVFGLPPGLGSCASWRQRLDGRLMGAMGSIPAFKGVEVGLGFEAARRRGSQVHDAIGFDPAQRESPNFGFVRKTNNAGGVEGGMTTGQTLVVRGAMKPISTLLQGMDSVDLRTLRAEPSDYERSDICAVPAASVVAENVVAFEIARAWLDKFAGDTMREVRAAYEHYAAAVKALPDA